MCILFLYLGSNDKDSDYRLILISNRDEFYNRPTQNMAPWSEDFNVIGGRDLEANCDGGTWLAISPMRKKIGVLLNLPGTQKQNSKSRGKIVADFVKSEMSTNEYIDCMKSYVKECNEFVFVSVEFGNALPSIFTYSNATDKLSAYTETHLGFSNSLPGCPLKKVEEGKTKLQDICNRLNKVYMKQELVDELIELLKSKERHLPDTELERRRPNLHQQLSSIFVSIPEGRYGTRTHTLVLITKTEHIDVIEISLQSPIDVNNPVWKRSEFHFDV